MTNHRLHALCPYFAMFPPSFARESILKFSDEGDVVLDPFCGRGTTLLEAVLNDRIALASDINPVAEVITRAKAKPPQLHSVVARLDDLEKRYMKSHGRASAFAASLPDFFHRAYHAETLTEIVYLRQKLDVGRRVDCFIAALVLGHLHGESSKSPSYLSNQMPHTIAVKPNYAMRYWEENSLIPPMRNAFELIRSRAKFRLEDGAHEGQASVSLVDARHAGDRFWRYKNDVRLIVTSPPYLDVTNFEEDQWLRLWFLGGESKPTYGKVSRDDRHTTVQTYFAFLTAVWQNLHKLLSEKATMVCRLGVRTIGFDKLEAEMHSSVTSVWERAKLREVVPSDLHSSQARALLPESRGCEREFDFVFALN